MKQRMVFRIVVIVLISASIGAYILVKSLMSQTDVKVGKLYSIMLYPCTQDYDKGDGKIETERMVDVVFIATNPRDMRRQLVRPALVKKDESLPKGQGGWMEVDLGTTEGIYYGNYREFRFNGNLQTPSQIPQCRQ